MTEQTPTHEVATSTALRVQVNGENVQVHGTVREDAAGHTVLAAAGFGWSKALNAWTLRRNLRPDTRLRAVEQVVREMESLGRQITVEDTGRQETAAERRRSADVRLSARADRLEQRAEDTQEHADRQRAKAEIIWTGYAGGPILEDHHSATRHRRDLERADHAMRTALDAEVAAAEQDRLAHQIRHHQEHGDNPITIKLRVQAKERKLRTLRRPSTEPANSEWVTQREADACLLEEEIALDQAVLADMAARGETRNWGPGDFQPGDGVHFGGARWYEVTRVNSTTLTVKANPGTQQKAPYLKVTGRRRNSVHQTAADLLAADLKEAL